MPIHAFNSGAELSSSSRFLHRIIGKGSVADIIYWRNKKISAAILIASTIIWFLFEIAEYPFVTFICQILIISMFVILIWSNLITERGKRPLTIEDFGLSESACSSSFSKLNQFLVEIYDISSGKNFRQFVLIIAGLWIFSILGTYVSSLTLIYTVFLCLETLPVFYERYKDEVDHVASKGGKDMRKLLSNINSKVLQKSPKGSVKDKKRT